MPQQKLTPEQQRYVVTHLACYDSPVDIATELTGALEVHVGTNMLQHYDPTKYMGRMLSAELKELFYETRTKFLENVSKLPISDAAYRLVQLQRLAERAEARCDVRGALAAYAQAAREVGGCYQKAAPRDSPIDQSEVSGPDGKRMRLSEWLSLMREEMQINQANATAAPSPVPTSRPAAAERNGTE